MAEFPELCSNQFQKTTPPKPLAPQPESIDKTFRRAALLAHCLGLFPCSSVLLKDPRKSPSPHYLLLPLLVSIILYISSVTGTFFVVLLYLKEFRFVNNLPVAPTHTDKFSLKTFLSSLLLSRTIAPLFCLLKAKSLALLVQSIARYDKTFQVHISAGFINPTFAVLILTSVISAVANTYVTWPVMYNAYKENQFPTMFRLFGVKSPVLEFLHGFSAGFYGELGLIFLSSSTLFLARGINKRIKEIESSLFDTSSRGSVRTTHSDIAKLAGKKIKAIYGVKQDFEDIFASLMIMYVGFSLIILVTTFYSLVSIAVHFRSEQVLFVWTHEFLSILSVVLLTCFRLMAFVECGENLAKSVTYNKLASHFKKIIFKNIC